MHLAFSLANLAGAKGVCVCMCMFVWGKEILCADDLFIAYTSCGRWLVATS